MGTIHLSNTNEFPQMDFPISKVSSIIAGVKLRTIKTLSNEIIWEKPCLAEGELPKNFRGCSYF